MTFSQLILFLLAGIIRSGIIARPPFAGKMVITFFYEKKPYAKTPDFKGKID